MRRGTSRRARGTDVSGEYLCWKCQDDITEKVARALGVSLEDLRHQPGTGSRGPVVVVCGNGHRNGVRVSPAV
jgi:hypothetical protein